MDKERLAQMADDPKYIPGIYNYCDRWCERCPYSDRCLTYAMEQEKDTGKEEKESTDEDFYKNVTETLAATTELLREIMDNEGINPNDVNIEEIQQKNEEHPLGSAAKQYGIDVHNWMKAKYPALKEKENEFNEQLEMGLNKDELMERAAHIREAIEVISWYQHQIGIKTLRAMNQDKSLYEDMDDVPNDADGSAKVALLGIDRSIEEWERLHKNLPEMADDYLSFLGSLEKLRKDIEQEFPNARSFVRPGFDTL